MSLILWQVIVCLVTDFFMWNLLCFTGQLFSNPDLVRVTYAFFVIWEQLFVCDTRIRAMCKRISQSKSRLSQLSFLPKSSLICELVYIYIGFMVKDLFFNYHCTQIGNQLVVLDVFPHFYFDVRGWFRTPASSRVGIFMTMVDDLLPSVVVTKSFF